MTLRALEAAVRHHSYSSAAAELHVTHGAISHHIRQLETALETPLFQRRGNGMEPLPAAAKLAVSVSTALSILGRAVEETSGSPASSPLILSVEQGFARKWLVKHLGRLQEETGEADLDIRLENRWADFVGDGVDAAIRFGDGVWPGYEVTSLFRVSLFPVCSPRLVAKYGSMSPADLYGLPLLRHTHPMWSWPTWFRELGLAPPPDRGPTFDDSSLMLEASVEGLGVALARSNLVVDDLAQGRLVKPCQEETFCSSGYFFVWRSGHSKNDRIQRLREWLMQAL
jgi:LysR family glycine cleavage system transcriptional activator